jgi:hypothetical protein
MALSMALCGPAFAEEECKGGPKEQWRSVEELKAAVTALGYRDISKVIIEDGCYEAVAVGPDGKIIDVLLDPVTLEFFKTETPD